MADFDDRVQIIGSSIKVSWRAKQLQESIRKVICIKDDGADVRKEAGTIQAVDALADGVTDFREALHEFASETDTKVIERALSGVGSAARVLACKVIVEEVSSLHLYQERRSLTACRYQRGCGESCSGCAAKGATWG